MTTGSPLSVPPRRPRLAITLGDVAGVGPEIVTRCWDERLVTDCEPVVVGHPVVLARAAASVNPRLQIAPVEAVDEIEASATVIPCWNPGDDAVAEVPPGRLDARAGRAAYEWLKAASWAAQAGAVDGIVTAPLSKAALHLAGLKYPGHTEILAELCGVTDFAMMLYLPRPTGRGLGVAHVTLHTSIRSVPDLLSTPRIAETTRLLGGFLARLPGPAPRLGVCALNPHAGEEGLFGDEEARLIAPAVAEVAAAGWSVSGPWPADTLLKRAWEGEFDGVVAMYHDQGHIALKLVGFQRAVNVTLGLPIVRTSPSHGTAFDIAGQGRASPEGLREAIQVAIWLANHRAGVQPPA